MATPAPAVRRTRAHDRRQLAAVLGWTADQVTKAVVLGVLPPYDLMTPRWTAATVDSLAARREELTAALDDGALLTEEELRDRLGLERGEWRRARDHDMIPIPDQGGFWSRSVAETLAGDVAVWRDRIPPQPLGAGRCAELLAELTGLAVTEDDLRRLVEQGQVPQVDEYKNWPLYDVAALRRLVATEDGVGVVTAVVAERQAWLASSISMEDAARWLGWSRHDLGRVAAERGIRRGRFGRWARVEIARLTDDEELRDRVRREQLLGPDQSAVHMEIRRRDFDYVCAAGWVTPVRVVVREVGVRKTVTVPLYAVGDLEDVLAMPGVDWEAVRAVRPGEVSPLREHTRLPAARATVVRAFCAGLAAEYGIEVWPHFVNVYDRWEIDWERLPDGRPTRGDVAAALAAHTGAAAYAENIVLSTAVGDVIRQARADLEPGAAVIVDTETSDLDGVVVEIAIIDAATGAVLVDTLVNPDGVPVAEDARAVHGISDADLAAAPRWADVVAAVLAAVAGRRILAYNAPFDRARIADTHAHAGLDAALLPSEEQWGCLMAARSIWLRVGYRLPLGGEHRARGDAADAREVLRMLAAPAEASRAWEIR